ncbi:MAG: hypothetical protein IPF44_09660 [Betaproteobacteria bacterium]|nr:hypothetical protein [Betaproteobacteria bacterium]
MLRIQADNLDQPLDINAGTALDLGSPSAKFRTRLHLLVVADLHKRYKAENAAGRTGRCPAIRPTA